ncbi:hypothetical protein FIBSPDRAFT_1039575 [Athelia psychrophila]|uniref:RBR-type E3 ubiquitin transferase n=1 Tax=Athelia psychrophila TaxID=1759441 RepID=A0A166RMZ1_9AGAM|nr:hypothetical protein FIBSPDRAFT_1039575 [Fibularhizoctonia sp. CBS 109695]
MSMASEAPTGKPRVAFPNTDRTRFKRNNQTRRQHVQPTDHLKLDGKCRFFMQGRCKFGDLCKRSHGDPPGEVTVISPTVRMPTDFSQTEVPHHTSITTSTSSNVLRHPTTSSASTLSQPNAPTTTPHSNPSLGTIPKKQAKKPCFSWAKSGTCQFGSKCRCDHDVNVLLRIDRERQEDVSRIDEASQAREAAEADAAQKVQQALEEVNRAQQMRITLLSLQVKQQAELLEWNRACRAAEFAQKEQQAQEEAAAEAADRARQEAVCQRARNARIEEARRAREAGAAAQKAHEDAARRAAQAEVRRAQEAKQEEARRAWQAEQEARMVEVAKEEAAMTTQHILLDFTVVTFSAGLAIQHVLLGFESCRMTIKNLPIDATIKEVSELFTQQGIESSRFHVLGLDRTPAGKQEAFLIGHEDLKVVAIGLEEVDFRQERLSFEITGHSGGDGMMASGLDANTLTLTWQAPYVAYVVTCANRTLAQAKVCELDMKICLGRRVKAQINQYSLGKQVLISGFYPEVTDQDVRRIVGSDQVQRRKPVTFDTTQAAERIRRHISSIPGVQMTRFEQVIFDSTSGMYSAQVHFGSWTQTRDVFDRCYEQCFPFIGGSTFRWLQLPSTIQYTITISAPQYHAQRKSWDDLLATVQDKEGLKLSIVPGDRIHIVRVGGEDKKAVGSLKVRVESIAAGEKLEGWHLSLSQRFVDRVLLDTGALLRIDHRLRAVKVYGEPGPIEAARALVNSELALLESQEQTVLLKRQSVRFFVTRGLSILKEELGDDNATLLVSSVPAKVIIKGGEAAKHTLDRLIEESLDASDGVPRTGEMGEAACPICYDVITSPINLGCGHAYCSACIRHFLTSASTFPLVCMGDEDKCHAPIPIPVVQRFLPIQQFSNLLETAFITHIDYHPQDFKYCATPDCRQVYRCTTSDTASIIHCPSCLSSVCSACHEDGHEGMTCAERKLNNDPEEQERLNDELAIQSGFKKCPQCAVWIEKTEGCNHMECKCGAHICWVCMHIFNAQSVYEHMNTVHGGMYEANGNRAEPHFQPGAFAEQQEALRLIALRRAQLAQHEAEAAQDRLAQQVLHARQVREREDARRQEVARTAALHRLAELAEQQRHNAENARHRVAQQLAQQAREQVEQVEQQRRQHEYELVHRPIHNEYTIGVAEVQRRQRVHREVEAQKQQQALREAEARREESRDSIYGAHEAYARRREQQRKAESGCVVM